MGLAGKACAAVVLILQASPVLAEFEIDEAADLTGTGLFLPPAALDPCPPPEGTPTRAAASSAARRGLRADVQGRRLHELSGLSLAVGATAGILADEAIRREVFPKLATAAVNRAHVEIAKAQRLARRLRNGRRPRPTVEAPPEPEPAPRSGSRFAGLVALGFVSFLLVRRRAGREKSAPAAAEAVATPAAKRPKSKAAPPPPPARGKGVGKGAARQKAATVDEAFLSPRSAELARFGKRIHWVKPSCEEPQQDTIFGELNVGHTQSEQGKLQFDKNLMDAMFTPRSARGSAVTPRKSWTGPKPQGLCLLDNSRAHNVAIVLTKLAMSTKELSQAIRLFDTGSSWLRADHVELLTVAMPTTSEATKLLAHKDKEDSLRDVEKRMLPLCDLSPARIKVMKFALSYQTVRENLVERCKVLQLAAEESRNSIPFRELLAIVLEAGNYINGGAQANAQGERVRAFGIESLQSLANFKVGCISCMHFLCITMRASDRRFLSGLEESLKHVRAASKERFNQLRSDVEAFLGEVNFAAARLREMTVTHEEPRDQVSRKVAEIESPKVGIVESAGKEEPTQEEVKEPAKVEPEPVPWPTMSEEDLARERLSMIVSDCTWKANQLRQDLARTEQASVDLQTYFSVASPRKSASPRKEPAQEPGTPSQAGKPHHRVPPEQFFGYIAGFLDMVKGSWNEIDSNPSRWRQFFNSADGCKGTGAESFARRISESHMEPGKDGDMSPRKRSSGTSSEASLAPIPSPRRSLGPKEVADSPKVGPLSPRRATLEAPLSPRRPVLADSPKVAPVPEDKEMPQSPRRRRRGTTPRSAMEEAAAAAAGPTTPRVRAASEDTVNHASPPAKVPPKVPKLNLKRQSPRAVTRKWSDLPDTDRSLKGFITAMHSPENKPAQSPQHAPRDPLSTSSSSASVLGDKVFAEDSASSSETDGEVEGRTPGLHEQGYASTSASSDTGLNGRESPASASSPNFAPLPGAGTLCKVPPLKMSKVFGPRGITPSFGLGTSIAEKPAEIKKGPETSPRRLLSARSGEDTGTARKIASNRSQKAEPLDESEGKPVQTCEFHQMNDSTDCEYHKLADSDTDMTQSDEEFELRRRKSISSEADAKVAMEDL